VAIVTVTKADGTRWSIDDTLLTVQLPTEPPPGSYVTVDTGTVLQEWARTGDVWAPVETPADTHPWSFVCAQDATGVPKVAFQREDRDFLRDLIQRVNVDGASVLTVEGSRLRCVSNPAGGNVTAQLGATTQHLSRRAAARFALGLLGAVAASGTGAV
jgi:hypothetical protein